jgi:hypothetical protein
MGYHVCGWIESNWERPQERDDTISMWEPLLSLGPFGLIGDAISNYLFGLARSPDAGAVFSGRGVPRDCSDLVRSEVERNERFIATYGEGDFGHTYATWGEVLQALAAPHAPKPYDDELVGGWKAVIESIGFLSSRVNANRQPYDQLRLIVWAIW